jgi:hypothetical protein
MRKRGLAYEPRLGRPLDGAKTLFDGHDQITQIMLGAQTTASSNVHGDALTLFLDCCRHTCQKPSLFPHEENLFDFRLTTARKSN